MNPLKILCLFMGNTRKLALLLLVFSFGFNSVIAQSWQHYDSLRLHFQNNRMLDSAIVYGERALEAVIIESGGNDSLQASMLFAMGNLSFQSGNYENAILYHQQETDIVKFTKGDNHPDYGNCLNSLAFLNRHTGRYDKALPYALKALEISELTQGKDHSEYGIRANNLASLYISMGQADKALPLAIIALENAEKSLGKDHASYGTRLNNLAFLYKQLGQYERALPLFIESLENAEASMGKEHPNYNVRLNNLALLYRDMGLLEKAMPLFIELYEKSRNNIDDYASYGIRLNNLALLYRDMGLLEKALPLYLEAIEHTKQVLGENHSIFGTYLNNLANLYRLMEDYDNALILYLDSRVNAENNLGKEHPDYGVRLINLAQLYKDIGDIDKILPLYIEAFENNFINIQRAFTFLSEKEKENFIKTVSSNFELYQSFFYEQSKTNPIVGAYAYNIELATKGMILQSGIEMRQAVLNSRDIVALEKYDEWVLIRRELSKQYSMPLSERIEDIENMENKAERLEGELTRLSGSFSQVSNLTKADWKEVKSKLNKTELAIEIARFNYSGVNQKTDSIVYVALIIGHDYEYPHIVPLFEEKQLENITGSLKGNNYEIINTLYGQKSNKTQQSNDLYNLIWSPLIVYLEDVKTIYLSPSGLLHKISFSAISNENFEFMCDIYNINLISSTSQTRQAEEFHISSAAMFGGIKYSTENSAANTWEYLPGTLREVEKLANKLKNTDIEVALYTYGFASEEKFKSIAGNSDLLHIATHGFFFPDPKKSKAERDDVIISGEVMFRGADSGFGFENFKNNANPLMRSGLVFAGVNEFWGSTIKDLYNEDGVLTAYEVANMNLQNTGLVVLSACETGLGDIRGSEGVYGLQRAFKMAGAKYLIMSLWQVPDKETVEFMEIFYSKLLNNKDIRKAFSETQREMRQKYDPFYWAAFVLVE